MSIFGIHISVPAIPVPKSLRRQELGQALRDYLRCDFDPATSDTLRDTIISQIDAGVEAAQHPAPAPASVATPALLSVPVTES